MVCVLIKGAGRWENSVHLDRKDRLCLVCKSSQHVEDEHHFIFCCPLYSHITARPARLFQQTSSVSDFVLGLEYMWWFH